MQEIIAKLISSLLIVIFLAVAAAIILSFFSRLWNPVSESGQNLRNHKMVRYCHELTTWALKNETDDHPNSFIFICHVLY